jgi:hypothetical protein
MKARRILLCFLATALLGGLTTAASAQPADIVTVGTALGFGGPIDVPVYIRDTSGTPLGVDQPAGSKIQSFSIKVDYSPASVVQSVSFTRAGITVPLTPTFENSPSGPGSITLIDTFQESTNPIPFTLNSTPPGDLVGHLVFTMAPSVARGQLITLTLDPTLTQLTDQSGSSGTKESVGNANLVLVNGSISIAALVPTLTDYALLLLAASLAIVAVTRMRA